MPATKCNKRSKRSKRAINYNYGDFVLTTFSEVGARINKQMFNTYDEARDFSKGLSPGVVSIISKIVFNSAEHPTPSEM